MPLPSRAAAMGAGFLAVAGVSGAAAVLVVGHSATPTSTHLAQSPAAVIRPVSGPNGDNARQVYDSAKDSVAYISAQLAQGQATGSGFVVSADGRIVTNAHVVDGAQQVSVKLGTSGQEQAAQVLAVDTSKDLALLQVDTGGKKLHPLTFADSGKVQVGQTTYAIGNPYGLDHTFTSGIVSALGRSIQSPDGSPIDGAIQTDAAINPGNSGGALLDVDGGVIGVNSQIASANSSGGESGNVGIGFAIPSNTVKDFIAHPTSSTAQAQPEEQTAPQEEQVLPDEQQQQDESPVDPYGLDQAPDDQSQGADPSYGYTPSPDGGYELVP